MKVIWLAILFLSGSWSFLTPIFVQNHLLGLIFFVLGCALNVLAFRRVSIRQIDKKYYLICAPLLITALVAPFPYNLGFILTLTGLAAVMLRSHFRWASGLGIGLIFSGLILIIQCAVLPLYFKLASRYHEIDSLTFPVCYFMKILGLKCAYSQNTLFVWSATHILEFTTTLEKLGIYSWLNISLGTSIIILFFANRHRGRWLIFQLVASLIYLLIRYASLILLYLNFERMSVFWNPWLSIGSFAPLMLIFMKFIPLRTDIKERSLNLSPLNITNRNRLIIIAASAFLSMFFLIGFWGFQDPGIIKKGRIIIDEKHSNWELTTRAYDTKWFGRKSGYNYYCLADYLHYYYQIQRNFDPITSKLLDNCDVLIIKTPTSIFSSDEIKSILEFVKNGGGLFLIGDHTNVFGTGTFINPVAKQFGLRFNYDATYDLKTGELSIFKPPKLLPHPVVQYLPTFLFGTSCTLEAPLSAEEVIIGYGLKSLELDYSQKNFFSKLHYSTNMNFGLFLQSAGLKYGKGRVLAFTDSTVFSNFWLFMPGKPELLLGSINWLNRKNYLPDRMNFTLLITGFLFMGTTCFLILKKRSFAEGLFIMLCSSFLSLPFAIILFQNINNNIYPLLKPHTKFTKVCFETEHSDFFLPILGLVKRPEISYHTFYVWTQRLGYVPIAMPKLQDALKNGDVVIIINPTKSFTDIKRNQILDYVNGGGRVVLIDSSFNKSSTANEFLKAFDMKINMNLSKSSFFNDPSGRKIPTTQQSASIEGGESVLFTENKDPILSLKRKGQGLVVVMADSMLFSDSMLGSTGTVPTPEQLKLYELEFWMLKELIKAP